jgi:hypothetical protein
MIEPFYTKEHWRELIALGLERIGPQAFLRLTATSFVEARHGALADPQVDAGVIGLIARRLEDLAQEAGRLERAIA